MGTFLDTKALLVLNFVYKLFVIDTTAKIWVFKAFKPENREIWSHNKLLYNFRKLGARF